MRTNTFTKGLLALVTFTLGLGSVSLAQLYSSGNNQISGSSVGIGTNDPEGKLHIKNDIVMAAVGNQGPSAPATDDPALRIEVEVDPNNNQPTTTYTWDVDAAEDFILSEGTGSQQTPLLKVSSEESMLGGTSALIAEDFHLASYQSSNTFKYTMGLGAKMVGSYFTQINSGQSGVALQNHNGTMRFFTGIGNNTSALPKMIITHTGRVGIGTTNPSSELEVKNGDFEVENGMIQLKNGNFNLTDGNLSLEDGELKIKDGRLVIGDGQGNNQFEVADNGYVVAREILVDANEPIPDYVFADDYDLLPLTELREYIDVNFHLPNIPSASEFEAKGGIEVGELSRLLLEKQEELVLYILQLEDRIAQLESSNAE